MNVNGTEGRPVAKPKRLTALWYCLSLLADGRWVIVDNSDPSVLGAEPSKPRGDVAQLGEQVAMEFQAITRARKARELAGREVFTRLARDASPDGERPTAEQVAAGVEEFVIEFVAVSLEDASLMTGIPIAGPASRRALSRSAPEGRA